MVPPTHRARRSPFALQLILTLALASGCASHSPGGKADAQPGAGTPDAAAAADGALATQMNLEDASADTAPAADGAADLDRLDAGDASAALDGPGDGATRDVAVDVAPDAAVDRPADASPDGPERDAALARDATPDAAVDAATEMPVLPPDGAADQSVPTFVDASDATETGMVVTDAGSDASLDAAPDAADSGGRDLAPDQQPSSQIAVAVGYKMRRVRSLDGTTWDHLVESSDPSNDASNALVGVAFGGGTFLAVGGHSFTSTDGSAWIDRGLAPGNQVFGAVAWLNDRFIAVGSNGLRARSLDLGATWDPQVPYEYDARHYGGIAAGKGMAIAVGETYGDSKVGVAVVTTDGKTWSEPISSGAGLGSIAFGNGTFVAVGESGRCVRSTDGASWVDCSAQGETVVFVNGEFILNGSSVAVSRSSDGATWTALAQSRDVAGYFNGRYLNLAWPAQIWSSPDLTNWTRAYDLGGLGLVRIAVGQVGP